MLRLLNRSCSFIVSQLLPVVWWRMKGRINKVELKHGELLSGAGKDVLKWLTTTGGTPPAPDQQ